MCADSKQQARGKSDLRMIQNFGKNSTPRLSCANKRRSGKRLIATRANICDEEHCSGSDDHDTCARHAHSRCRTDSSTNKRERVNEKVLRREAFRKGCNLFTGQAKSRCDAMNSSLTVDDGDDNDRANHDVVCSTQTGSSSQKSQAILSAHRMRSQGICASQAKARK